ncbi:MAG: PKD domain-containing protein [Lewinellaceae bacterium]|nr:PKD domain-containing protein [Lewinellaceae bacterium]
MGSAISNLIVTAHGGKGGNTFNNNQNRCFGPGGGGGGGRILTNQPGILPPQGGPAGLVQGSTNGCNGTSGAATAGQAGMVETLPVFPAGDVPFLLPEIIVSPQPMLVCAGEPAVFSVQANGGDWSYQWQVNAGAGWINASGPGFAGFDTNTLLLQNTSLSQTGLLFRCIVQKSSCFSVTSTEALLTVETVPVANFSYDVLAGGLIRFSNLSLYADGYFWDFGDGTPATDSVDVTHQYTQSGIYTVTLTANNSCGASVLQVDIQVMLSGTGQAVAWYLDEVKVFPNPATGHLNLEYPAAAGPLLGVQVLDTTGKCLYGQSEISNVISLGDFPPGILLVRLTFLKGVATRTVVKQ